MNFINAATKKERTHVEEIIKSQPVMPHEGITATEIGICGKQNLLMDVYRPDNDAEKHPIIIDIHGGGLIAGRKEQNQNLATWLAKEGYLTFVPDYRLVPETNVFGQITDVINAFATVAERAEDFVGDLNQVFVVADSAGAFLACMASSILRYPVKMQPVEDELEENVRQLQAEQEEAEKRLETARKEINTQKLEAVKVEAKTAIIAKVGSLLGSGEIKELKQENQQLRDEVVARDESIERLQIMMQKQREQYSRELVKVQGKHIKELDETRKEISRLSQMIKKACAWLPLLKELFRMERLCRVVGFSTEQTAKLMLGEKIEHNGTLYSEEYKRNFVTDKVTAQIVTASTVGKNKLVLIINRKNVSDWFREQFSKLYQRIQPKEEQKRSKGFSL